MPTRISFDFSEESLQRLDALKASPEQTRAEVIRLALRAYEWLSRAAPGTVVELREPSGQMAVWIKIEELLKEKKS